MKKKQNKKWTKEEILLIMNYRKAKIKYKIIGEILNVTVNSIYKTLKRYGFFQKIIIKNPSSFLEGIQWFNRTFSCKIIYNKLNFNFLLNNEIYSKISILIMLNRLLLKYNLKLINDNKFIKYKFF